MKWRQLHNPITENTLLGHRSNFKHHLSDYFAKYRLDEIIPAVIEDWQAAMNGKGSMKDNGKAEKKTLKANTINLAFGTLKLMLGEAVRKKTLKENPCRLV